MGAFSLISGAAQYRYTTLVGRDMRRYAVTGEVQHWLRLQRQLPRTMTLIRKPFRGSALPLSCYVIGMRPAFMVLSFF